MILQTLTKHYENLVEKGELSAGHARALLTLSPAMQENAARSILSGGLSVRQTEALVKKLTTEKKPAPPKDPDQVDYAAVAQTELTDQLGRGVKIITGKKKGRVELEYYDVDDLNALLEALEKLKK